MNPSEFACVKQAAKQEEAEDIDDNSKTPSKSTPHPNVPPNPPVPLLPVELHPPSPPNTITSALAPSIRLSTTRKVSSLACGGVWYPFSSLQPLLITKVINEQQREQALAWYPIARISLRQEGRRLALLCALGVSVRRNS
ncbi:hypothetical protein D9613_003685 [Agrocybe pediades]|uniref:Uncharacterized protein n=1 Tax=Agrocybe pediades TaxID=84607 RepID=A0A8H4QID4_9AGAR|nr:hypothetical protein D9613_003685 [Agrocybe pediades]